MSYLAQFSDPYQLRDSSGFNDYSYFAQLFQIYCAAIGFFFSMEQFSHFSVFHLTIPIFFFFIVTRVSIMYLLPTIASMKFIMFVNLLFFLA